MPTPTLRSELPESTTSTHVTPSIASHRSRRPMLARTIQGLAVAATADRDELHADDGDLAFISIRVQDAQGTVVSGADRPVTVEVSGSGVLAGMCSANPKTTERFDSATWTTFDGRAVAVVRPTGVGAVTVTVTSEGSAPIVVPLRVTGAGSKTPHGA